MTISILVHSTAFAATALLLGACATTGISAPVTAATASVRTVTFQQVRNATIKVEYAGTTFLIDPMLARKGAYPGFEDTYNSHLRNPLVELPVSAEEVMKADAVIVTHTHRDHWDGAAKQGLPKNIPIFAQNEVDAESIRKDGFTDVRVLTENTQFNGTRMSKVEGQHLTEEMKPKLGERFGKASGIVFQRTGYKTVYVAGDTIWIRQVEDAIEKYRPNVIVLNTGYARMLGYDGSIIMGKEDLHRAYQLAPGATVIGSHMESVNHATQTRQDLLDYVSQKGMDRQRILVPRDGETYRF